MKKPELLAPAGTLEVLKYAISAGADAVYCAGKSFGARSYAGNFSNEEIIEAAEYVHLRFKKIYITVNTLIFESEFNKLKEYIDFLYKYVDGIIVQDLGVFHYVRKTYPDFPVHMSTQCNIHNVEDAKFFQKLGSTRLVLAREVPLDVVKQIINLGIEVELFVHGALCFSFSGNCYMSYMIGGRSGNRGSCAQPCRKSYQLFEDGKSIKTGSLLSMKDLMTLKNIPELCDMGVASFKIEGRMKNKEYVVSTVKAYRKAIDDWANNKKYQEDKKLLKDMLVTFNRDFTKGYLFGALNNNVTTTKGVNHQGIVIGEVINYYENNKGKQVDIKLTDTLSINDGIRIGDSGHLVTRMFQNRQMVKTANSGIITIDVKEKIKKNALVLKTFDSTLSKEIENVLKNNEYYPLVDGYFIITKNKLTFEIKNKQVSSKVSIDVSLDNALKEVDYNRLKDQLSKTNNLPLVFKNIRIVKDNEYFIPIPLINQIRQACLNEWVNECNKLVTRINIPYEYKLLKENKSLNKIKVICRTEEQEDYCKKLNYDYYNNEEVGYRIDFNLVKEVKKIANHLSEIGVNSDISPYLNICNKEAIEFMRCFTKGTIYLALETLKEDLEILKKYDNNLGILVYSKIPLMISNHCVVSCSKGYEKKKCGECYKHSYFLQDNYGNDMDLYFENCIMYILGNKVHNILDNINKEQVYESLNYLVDLYNEQEF